MNGVVGDIVDMTDAVSSFWVRYAKQLCCSCDICHFQMICHPLWSVDAGVKLWLIRLAAGWYHQMYAEGTRYDSKIRKYS